jgi:hypothetical protein
MEGKRGSQGAQTTPRGEQGNSPFMPRPPRPRAPHCRPDLHERGMSVSVIFCGAVVCLRRNPAPCRPPVLSFSPFVVCSVRPLSSPRRLSALPPVACSSNSASRNPKKSSRPRGPSRPRSPKRFPRRSSGSWSCRRNTCPPASGPTARFPRFSARPPRCASRPASTVCCSAPAAPRVSSLTAKRSSKLRSPSPPHSPLATPVSCPLSRRKPT